jgi:uncharacterized protein (TIGR00156 family)
MSKLFYVLPAVLLFGVSAAGAQSNQPAPTDFERNDSAAPGKSSAQGKPAGAAPKNSAPITSAQGVASAKADQPVKLRGTIVSEKSKNQYIFTDGTGNVDVDIPSKVLNGSRLSAGTQVEIVGEVDTRLFKRQPKVEAKSVTVVASSISPGGSGAPMKEQSGRPTPPEGTRY